MDLSFGNHAVGNEDEWIKYLNGINSVRTAVGRSTSKGLSKLQKNGCRIGKGAIILDTGSKVSIFSDRELFGRIVESDRPIIIEGINAEAEGLLVTDEGITEFGLVYFDSRASANILSYSVAVDSYDRVQYDKDNDIFIIRVSQFQPA